MGGIDDAVSYVTESYSKGRNRCEHTGELAKGELAGAEFADELAN